MAKPNKLDAYQAVEHATQPEDVNPYHIVKLLMQGVLDKLSLAKSGIINNNPKIRGENIGAAITLIGGLQCGLDMEQGKDIARNLNDLYDYMTMNLPTVNINNDVEKLEEIIKIMNDIKDGWDAIEAEALKLMNEQGPVNE